MQKFEFGNACHLSNSCSIAARLHGTLDLQKNDCLMHDASHAVPSGIWQVESFARCLSLRDLASLACAQKDWQASIESVYSSPRVQQLVQALEASLFELKRHLAYPERATERLPAPLINSKSLRQLWAVVSFLQYPLNAPWGPAVAAAPGLHEDLTQLFTVPQLPCELKIHLIEHMDLRISYQQLMAAAHQQVAGVDVWVHVQRLQDRQSDLPAVVVSVCCHSGDLHLDQLQSHTSKEIEDILQLAFNLTYHCPNMTLVIAELTPKVSDPARLFQLLQTAVARGHREALQSVVSNPAASQLAPSAVLQLMQAARPSRTARAGDLLQSLVKLPAAATLSAENLVPLLQQAVVDKCETSIKALCSLPAAHHIPLGDLISMLDKTVLWKQSAPIRALCSLSAAAALTAADIMPLMSKAMTEAGDGIQVLCTLPAAQHLPFSFYNRMLEWAVTHSYDETVTALCSLPAATEVDAASWVRFVEKSFTICPGNKAVILCSMSAAPHASPEDLPALWKLALQQERWPALTALCQLPSAQQVPPEDFPGLVRLIKSRPAKPAYDYDYGYGPESCNGNDSASNTLQLLASLGSVQDMTAADLLEIIEILVQRNRSSEDMLQLWFKCSAAHNMSMNLLIQHMQEAIRHENAGLLEALYQVPAAARMCNVDALLQLFDDALKVSNYCVSIGILNILSKLPAAVRLTSRQLAGVLSAVVERGSRLPSKLCEIPAASLLPVAKVADLLQTVIKSGNIMNVKLLCSMQVSNCLSSDVIRKLLLAALDLDDDYDDDDRAHYGGYYDDDGVVAVLCSLSGAAEIANIGDLLDQALPKRNDEIIQEFCELPAARKFTVDTLVYFLDKAFRIDSETAVQSLCQLPNANCIQKKGVLQLIQTAVRIGRMKGIPSLCHLRAAHRLSPGTLLRLLEQLAPKGDAAALLAVTQLLRRVLRAKKYFSKRG